MNQSKLGLSGVYAAMVTPYGRDGAIDLETAARLAEYIADQGVDGILPCGTTGEFPLLSFQERAELFTLVQRRVGERCAVLANVSSMDVRETALYIQRARQAGIRRLSVVTPYYYGFDQPALKRYFQWISREAEDMELYLYNIPSNAKNTLSPRLFSDLCQTCPNLRGVKDSSMDFMSYTDYLLAAKGRAAVLTGNDAQILPALQAGGQGAVVASAGVLPRITKGIHTCFLSGDLEGARRRQRVVYELRSLCRGVMPVVAHKFVLERLGFPMGSVRSPFRPLTEEEIKIAGEKTDLLFNLARELTGEEAG